MKKSRIFMIAGIITLALVAAIGIGIWSFAGSGSMQGSATEATAKTALNTSTDSSRINASSAKEKAISEAAAKYGISKSSVCDLEAERDYENGECVWDVSFDAAKKNGKTCEFEYEISCADGTVKNHHMEYDDQDDRYEHEGACDGCGDDGRCGDAD